MSRLGDLEASIVSRLSTAIVGGETAFATVEGASGTHRPTLLAAMRRERVPVAYVSFVDEALAPETRDTVRGPRFAVLVADRTLRVPSDPRQGDATSAGTLALLQAARSVLDDYAPSEEIRLIPVHEKFILADERFAVYELLYRAWPVNEPITASPTFDGVDIVGNLSEIRVEIGGFDVVEVPDTKPTEYTNGPRPIIWRGEIRATTHSQLWTIENNIETLIAARTTATISDAYGQDLDDCLIERYDRNGPRRVVGMLVVQLAAIQFSQLEPVL